VLGLALVVAVGLGLALVLVVAVAMRAPALALALARPLQQAPQRAQVPAESALVVATPAERQSDAALVLGLALVVAVGLGLALVLVVAVAMRAPALALTLAQQPLGPSQTAVPIGSSRHSPRNPPNICPHPLALTLPLTLALARPLQQAPQRAQVPAESALVVATPAERQSDAALVLGTQATQAVVVAAPAAQPLDHAAEPRADAQARSLALSSEPYTHTLPGTTQASRVSCNRGRCISPRRRPTPSSSPRDGGPSSTPQPRISFCLPCTRTRSVCRHQCRCTSTSLCQSAPAEPTPVRAVAAALIL
jgi:hypothetical protein